MQKLPETLLSNYMDGLYSYAMVLTRNHATAADLVQETYLRALRAIGGLRPDSNVKSWLFTILRNIWLNELRHRRTTPTLVELDAFEGGADLAVDTSKDPYMLHWSEIQQEQVRQAIQQLPAGYREIIVLREYEELSYQEIANALNCPVGTVMSRLARARSRLRTLLSSMRASPSRAKPIPDAQTPGE